VKSGLLWTKSGVFLGERGKGTEVSFVRREGKRITCWPHILGEIRVSIISEGRNSDRRTISLTLGGKFGKRRQRNSFCSSQLKKKRTSICGRTEKS